MKNIIKYLGCLALGLLILNKVDFSVYAAEPSKVVRHVEYDEITDVNQLLQMGIEEYQKTPKVRNQSENEEITVKQLLSITEYDDGTIEKEYCVTGLGMVDKSGKNVSAAQIARADSPVNKDKQVSNYGVTLVCSLYTTMRLDSVFDMSLFRVDKVTTTILRTGSVYPGNGSTRYNHQRGNEFKSVPFTASTASNQSFTIPGSANFYHSSPEPLAGGLVAQSDVSLSNGKSLSVIVGVPSDDPYAK